MTLWYGDVNKNPGDFFDLHNMQLMYIHGTKITMCYFREHTNSSTLEAELHNLQAEVLAGTEQPITVRRYHVYEDTISLLKSGAVKTNQILVVSFAGEPAVDTGGPRREYFTLLLKHIMADANLVEGSIGHLLPTQSVNGIITSVYETIGKLMAASIVQGGPPPKFFAESAVEYWLFGLAGVNVHVDDIPAQFQDDIKKVKCEDPLLVLCY